MSLNIVLHEPEIPQNTGNIARTCVLTGARLHIIKPTGFSLDNRYVRRAGLDYWHLLDLAVYENFEEFLNLNNPQHVYCATTKGDVAYSDYQYPQPAFLLFGKETSGLPGCILNRFSDYLVKVPMIQNEKTRSLNLSNTVAVIAYEVLRQWGFPEMR